MRKYYNISKMLYDAGVDIIEAGFPAVSDEELKTIKHINYDMDNICSLADSSAISITC